jgi:hypothetical protein
MDGPDFLPQLEEKWPVDLLWMKVNEEMRSTRVNFATQAEKPDWSKIQITPSDIPQLCELDERYLSFVRQCQEESFSEESSTREEEAALFYLIASFTRANLR